MAQDVAELTQEYLSDDPLRWAKLASDINWRRLQLLLLREILIELRNLNLATR
jgi:hypothetical protein